MMAVVIRMARPALLIAVMLLLFTAAGRITGRLRLGPDPKPAGPTAAFGTTLAAADVRGTAGRFSIAGAHAVYLRFSATHPFGSGSILFQVARRNGSLPDTLVESATKQIEPVWNVVVLSVTPGFYGPGKFRFSIFVNNQEVGRGYVEFY